MASGELERVIAFCPGLRFRIPDRQSDDSGSLDFYFVKRMFQPKFLRWPISLAAVVLALGGCEFRPVSSSLEAHAAPYVVERSNAGWRLSIEVPVTPGSLGRGVFSHTGPEYSLSQPPPGESDGSWVRRNTWYYPQSWGAFEEYWFGWTLLDIYSIDRAHHVSPLALQGQGTGALFETFASDHFTAYYPPEYFEQLQDFLQGTASDSVFGLFFRPWPRDTLVASRVDPGSAAWHAGMRDADRLLRFDGRWAATSLGYLRDSTRGRIVEFEVYRPSSGLVSSYAIRRSSHNMPTLYSDTLPGGVGYVSISQFVSTDGIATDELFQDAAVWLEANSTGPWILDLRDNGGGAIRAAERLVGALVPAGSGLVRYRERFLDQATLGGYESVDTARATDSVARRLTGRSILVLQDSNTASASEIVISALRENLGASVRSLGDTSYGKGIGQIYVSTPLDGFMAITCMHIDPLRAPAYHLAGIRPDDLLPYGDSTIAKAWEIALAAKGAGRKSSTSAASTPDFAAIGWNRAELRRGSVQPLLPATSRRPFEIR